MGILSISKQFHFIHIYKTAGSSIKSVLYPFGQSLSEIDPSFVDYLKCNHAKFLYHNPGGLYAHYTAAQALEYLGKDRFKKYYTFAVVRNPWDWMISLYCYIQQNPTHYQYEVVSHLSFYQFLQYEANRQISQSTFIIDSQNNIIVDSVMKFESLEADFSRICQLLDLSASGDLPLRNTSVRKPRNHYYQAREKDYVYNLFKDDINRFDYSFDEFIDRDSTDDP